MNSKSVTSTAKGLLALLARRMRNWAILSRLEYAGLSTVAIMGGLTTTSGRMSWGMVLTLFAVNGLIVAFGFVHNDLADEPFDRRSRDPGQRPLISGAVSHSEAWILAGVSLAGAMGLHGMVVGRLDSFTAMLGAFAFAAAYNLLGKKMIGSDILYGLSAASVGVCGFLAAREAPTEHLLLSPLAMTFAIYTFANHTFLNAIEGGLKDITLDRRAGVVTFALAVGVREEADRLIIPAAFRLAGWLLRVLALAACWWPVASGQLHPPWFIWIMLILCSLGALGFTHALLALRAWDRDRIGRLARMQESASGALFILVIASHAGLAISAFLVLAPIVLYMAVSRLLGHRPLGNSPTF